MVQKHSISNNNKGTSEPTNQFVGKLNHELKNNQGKLQEKNVLNWQPGQKLKSDRYTIKEKLSWGGFADIYLAYDSEENQNVVIKTLKSELRNKDDFDNFEENFVKEAMALHKLKHPYIVRFKNIIKTSDCWCIVMEYIEGEDLKTWVERSGQPLLERDALLYIKQIGEALIEVHNQELLHRDIKPKNIIRRADGLTAVLIDFGIARKYSPDKIEQHTPYLTEDYAPIEQYIKKYKRGAYTDVYALAATLYFLLTGKNATSSRDRYDGEPLVHPTQLNPNISTQVNNAIVLGMQIHPQERPQSIEEWLALLPLDESTNKLVKPNSEEKIQTDTEISLNSRDNEDNENNLQFVSSQTRQENVRQLSPLVALFTSPISFLIALVIISSLGTKWINAGFWLVLVLFIISSSLFIIKGRKKEQAIYLFLSSVLPTLILFTLVPSIRSGYLPIGGLVSIILTILASLVGFSLMLLYPQFSELLYQLFKRKK